MSSKGESEYRGYTIFSIGTHFVAESISLGDDHFEMIGANAISLTRAIDDLWSALDGYRSSSDRASLPDWYRDWIDAGSQGPALVPYIYRAEPIAGRFRRSDISAFMIKLKDIMAEGGEAGDVDAARFTSFLMGSIYRFGTSPITAQIEFKGKVFDLTTTSHPTIPYRFEATNLVCDGAKID